MLRRSWLILLIVALAFALRVWRLGAPEIGGDEAFSYDFISRSYAEIVRATLEMREPHPVGAYFVQKFLMAFGGESEFALRFASAWFGVLAVAILYRLGRDVGLAGNGSSANVALLAAMLMAISSFSLRHTRELRMYAFTLALTLAAAALAWRCWERRRARDLVAYGIVAWLAMQTHYYAAAVLLAVNIFWLIAVASRRSWREAWPWGVTQAALGLACAPWLWAARDTLGGYTGNADLFRPLDVGLRSLGALIAGERSTDLGIAYPLVASLALLVGTARIWPRGPAARRGLLFVWLYLLLPIAFVVFTSFNRPIFRERYFIAALAPFCLLAAAACDPQPTANERHARPFARPFARPLIWATIGVTAAAMVHASFGYYRHWTTLPPDWRNLARLVEKYSDRPPEQLRVVLNFPDPAFAYYYTGRAPFFVMPYRMNDAAGAEAQVDEMLRDGVRRVIFQVVPSFWDEQQVARAALAHAFTQVEEQFSGRWIVQIYARHLPEDLKPIGAIFGEAGEAIQLQSAAVVADGRGRLLEVSLKWQGDADRLAGSEKIFVHVTAAGLPQALIAQLDQPLTADDLAAPLRTFGIRLPDKIAPGAYEVRVGIYDPTQPGMPRRQTDTGDDAVVIATVTLP